MFSGKLIAAVLLAVSAPLCGAQGVTPSIPAHFDSTGEDRRAIETLLATYTRAVSTKNESLFETLLLNKQIPFSDAYSATEGKDGGGDTSHYEAFRRGVFAGPPFTQKFQNVHIEQDGPLADVSLVFVNSSAQGSSWGWKTMLLLKVEGHWKIASEFYTGHR